MNSLYGVGSLVVREVVALRLSSDAMQLEACFSAEAMGMSPMNLLGLVFQECAAIGVRLSLTRYDIEVFLRSYVPGEWATLVEAVAPSPPNDGRLELLVPVPVAAARKGIQGRRHAVRAGTPLARRQPGIHAEPGLDLLGRTVASRPPLEASLPSGANTVLSENGSSLQAACDGEILLRNLLIEVIPVHFVEGDVAPETSITSLRLPVFITGSVREGAKVEANGEIYVRGDTVEAQLRSRESSVTVIGEAIGSPQCPSLLRAATEITCGLARFAQITAGTDVRILQCASQSTLRAGRNVYLPRSVEQSLTDVEMQVDGGILPILDSASRFVEVPPDRRHVRVTSSLHASLALHSITTLVFKPCTLLDISAGGVRCALNGSDLDPSLGSIVQLKLVLLGSRGQLFAIAQVTRKIGPGLIGITFLQMSQRDHDRITTFCMQLVLKRPHGMLAIRQKRGMTRLPAELP